MKQQVEHPLSWFAIFRVVTVGLALFVIWKILGVIIIVLLSMMLAAALYPIVKSLGKKLPFTIAATIVILLLFLPIILVFITILPNFINQLPSLIKTLDAIVKSSSLVPNILKTVDINPYVQNTGTYILDSTSKITNYAATLTTIIFLTLYMLIDSTKLRKIFLEFVPKERRKRAEQLLRQVITINGHYIRGNLIISFICAAVITTGLLLLKIPFAVPLGIFAGIVDLLPLVGAVIGIIPAGIIAFAISPVTGILTILLFILYQQFENNILSPHIYNRVLDLSPALSFIAVLIGTSLFGIIGAFMALPVAASIPTIVRYINEERTTQDKEAPN